jgi:hypothetical protein
MTDDDVSPNITLFPPDIIVARMEQVRIISRDMVSPEDRQQVLKRAAEILLSSCRKSDLKSIDNVTRL